MTALGASAILPRLFLAAALSAAQPAAPRAFAGYALSAGPARRVTGRVTFDARKAASGGGWVYVGENGGEEDAAAVRMSRAVVLTGGGLFCPAAVAARRHGVPAVALPYGGRAALGLSEGDIVSVEPARASVVVPSAEDADEDLALDEALSAYEGLADAQALSQWWQSRADSPRAPALAGRLADGLAQGVLAGRGKADAAAKALASVRRSADAKTRPALDAAVSRALSSDVDDGVERLSALQRDAASAASPQAVERLRAEGRGLASGLRALAEAGGASASAARAQRAGAAFEAAARARLAEVSKRKPGSLWDALAAAGAKAPASAELGPDAYAAFLQSSGLRPLIEDAAQDASLPLARKAERIQGLFASAKLEDGSPAARLIAAKLPAGALVSVSGLGERRVVPWTRATEAVKAAWSDWWSADALGERKRAGKPLEPEPSVLLSAALPADASGVALSRDPASGLADRVLVTAGFGELEGVVSGEAPADQYVVSRDGSRELLAPLLADKRAKIARDPATGLPAKAVVPAGLSLTRALTPEQLARVARAARAAEAQLGEPVELSFEFSGGELVALGAKAATTAPAAVLP